MRLVTVLASVIALLALVVAPVMAQTQPPAAPPARPAPPPAAAPVEKRDKEVEGTVKKIDPATKSVQVSSGLLGLFGATLEVDDRTRINVEGKQGSLSDIREGARVKASYESREGRNIAKSIDVMPAEETPAAATSPARPAPPAGSPGSPAPSAAPATGQPQPKTQ